MAAKQQELEDDLKAVCAFYKDDFDQEMLYAQLQTFGVHFQQTYQLQSKEVSTKMTIFDITSYSLVVSWSEGPFITSETPFSTCVGHASHQCVI